MGQNSINVSFIIELVEILELKKCREKLVKDVGLVWVDCWSFGKRPGLSAILADSSLAGWILVFYKLEL